MLEADKIAAETDAKQKDDVIRSKDELIAQKNRLVAEKDSALKDRSEAVQQKVNMLITSLMFGIDFRCCSQSVNLSLI